MKRLHNERGAALILVLFGITLAMLFIMFQMSQLISTKTQVVSAEKNIDSKNIMKMATDRYMKEVAHALGANDIKFGVEIVDEVKTEIVDVQATIDSKIEKEIKEKLDDNHSYTIETGHFVEKGKKYEKYGILSFKVVATAYGKDSEWDGEITIKSE